MRISSLLRTILPRVVADEVVIEVPPSKVEMLEAVRFPFNRFIADKSENRLKKLRIDAGESVQTERKPYTDREKLEYLIQKNPKLAEVVKKLDLKLP